MKLYDLLKDAHYDCVFSIYITNAYDQNLRIGHGTRAEVLDENEHGSGVFDHLLDKVEHWTVKDNLIIVFISDEHYNEEVEKQFHDSDKFGDSPDKRPWRYSIETELYTDKYCNIIQQ